MRGRSPAVALVLGLTLAVALARPAATATAPAVTVAPPASASASGPPTQPLPALEVELDTLVQLGEDQPRRVLERLQALQPAAGDASALRRWRLALGLVQARDERQAEAQDSAAWLAEQSQRHGDSLALADAALVLAVLAETQGRNVAAGEHAQSAADQYEHLCGAAAPAPHPGCDARQRWRALMTGALSAGTRGVLAEQRRLAEAALAIARGQRDAAREVHSLTALANSLTRDGQPDAAARLLQQAQRIAELNDSAEMLARVRFGQAWVARTRGDHPAALRVLNEAQGLARRAGAGRLQAQALLGLSDLLIHEGRPAQALAHVESALALLRSTRDRRLERGLLHNAALARLSLRQVAPAKADVERLLSLWQEGGEGDLATVLRELSDALASAGDPAGALSLYHRERALAEQLKARNRQSAVRELQVRYDREVQQRHIELLERDSALKTAELANRDLMRLVWGLLAATLAVAAAFAVLVYLRVRETQRQLELSQASLRVQSERDALTGLANRRGFQAAMRQCGGLRAFEGALLLLDIDHFKQVNDRHGHAAGDEVLVEVAQRVQAAVRSDDLVVRWGGEEFLVFAPGLDDSGVQALAQRLLRSMAAQPVDLDGQPLRVTASIGHARFPLPPGRVALSWERALNFVDMALYTAKSLGRNRAVGISQVVADDAAALRAVESDFESACRAGRVTVTVSEGP